jgi:hypothetical protein
MGFQPSRQAVLLFGGLGASFFSDTWEWNGMNWALISPTGPPPGRAYGALSEDPQSPGALLLFGGFGGSAFLRDFWRWDGSSWTGLTPMTFPPARDAHGLAAHADVRRAIVFGGWTGSGSLGDTWEWSGNDWAQVTAAPSPPARFSPGMASVPSRRVTLLFGGSPALGSDLGDTWELDYGGCARVGPGQPGGGIVCTCETAPQIGTSFCVSFSYPPPQGAGTGLLLLAPGACFANPFTILPPGVCGPTWLYLLPSAILSGAGEPLRFCIPLPPSSARASGRRTRCRSCPIADPDARGGR